MTQTFDKWTIETQDLADRFLVKVSNNNAQKPWNANLFFEAYRRAADRDERVESFKRSWQSRMDYMAERKAARQSFVNPAKVGDILYSSWGYDQTNIDFYQITKVSGKAVYVREIAGHSLGEDGFMTAEKVAVKDHFIGEELRRFAKPCGREYCVDIDSVQTAWPWDGEPKRYSWYA